MKTITLSAPIYWATYLFNGDATTLPEAEIAHVDAWIEAEGLPAPSELSDASYTSSYNDAYRTLGMGRQLCECADYTFLIDG